MAIASLALFVLITTDLFKRIEAHAALSELIEQCAWYSLYVLIVYAGELATQAHSVSSQPIKKDNIIRAFIVILFVLITTNLIQLIERIQAHGALTELIKLCISVIELCAFVGPCILILFALKRFPKLGALATQAHSLSRQPIKKDNIGRVFIVILAWVGVFLFFQYLGDSLAEIIGLESSSDIMGSVAGISAIITLIILYPLSQTVQKTSSTGE